MEYGDHTVLTLAFFVNFLTSALFYVHALSFVRTSLPVCVLSLSGMCEPVRHRVLVTGASGLLGPRNDCSRYRLLISVPGSALVHALESSHTVYAFSHSRCINGKYPASVTCKQLDLTDESAVKSAFALAIYSDPVQVPLRQSILT